MPALRKVSCGLRPSSQSSACCTKSLMSAACRFAATSRFSTGSSSPAKATPERNTPHTTMIDAWRIAGRPIYHVRHDSTEPDSTYRPGQPGNDFKPSFEPRAGEQLIPKHTASAFIRTSLDALLEERSQQDLVVAGVITNNSVEASVRHAATLGFRVALAEDACFTFARRDWNGVLRSAAEVHAMSLANLHGEYCQVVTAAEVLAAAPPAPDDPALTRPATVAAGGDLEAMANDTVEMERWSRIDVPVLLMQGGQSGSPLPEGMDLLASAIPQAQRVVWSDQSHFATVTVPSRVAETIQQFLATV